MFISQNSLYFNFLQVLFILKKLWKIVRPLDILLSVTSNKENSISHTPYMKITWHSTRKRMKPAIKLSSLIYPTIHIMNKSIQASKNEPQKLLDGWTKYFTQKMASNYRSIDKEKDPDFYSICIILHQLLHTKHEIHSASPSQVWSST